MKRSHLALILVAVAFLGVGLAFAAYYGYYMMEHRTIPIDYYIAPGVMGLNTETDGLHLGGVPPGAYSIRRLIVTSPRDAHLRIGIKGNASTFVTVEPADAWIEADEPLEVKFRVDAPQNSSGNYTGKAVLNFYRS